MKQNSHGAKVEKKVPSALPIYLAAGAFLLCALALPIYRMWALAAAALIAAAAYVLGQKLFPPRTVLVDAPAAVYATGEQAVDEMLREAQENVDAIARLNEAIEDEKISAQIDHLEDTTAKIIQHVVENPQKRSQISRFLNYYLPTTLKLLNAYDRMGAAGVSGENIDGTMEKIEAMMDTIVMAFHKQLDALFRDEAMDIASDITVMENLLAQEGLIPPDQPDRP